MDTHPRLRPSLPALTPDDLVITDMGANDYVWHRDGAFEQKSYRGG